MLAKKGLNQKLKKKKSWLKFKPTKANPDQTKAILEVGFSNNPELLQQNPFIERQQQKVEEQKVAKLTERKIKVEKLDDFKK